MREIGRPRWNAFTSWGRHPAAELILRELSWYESDDGRAIATVLVDTDCEFHGIILARDGFERFRAVAQVGPCSSPPNAVTELGDKMRDVLPVLDDLRFQDGDVGIAVDFFAPRVQQRRLHSNFRRLSHGEEFSAAREMITEIMRWYEDTDGNFIEQFQTTGFDARAWELYLFAALVEVGLQVSRPKPAPDMLARGLRGEFALEATTINPTMSGGKRAVSPPMPHNRSDFDDYIENYLPIRYAGPLTDKRKREYWTMSTATGKDSVPGSGGLRTWRGSHVAINESC